METSKVCGIIFSIDGKQLIQLKDNTMLFVTYPCEEFTLPNGSIAKEVQYNFLGHIAKVRCTDNSIYTVGNEVVIEDDVATMYFNKKYAELSSDELQQLVNFIRTDLDNDMFNSICKYVVGSEPADITMQALFTDAVKTYAELNNVAYVSVSVDQVALDVLNRAKGIIGGLIN